MKPYSAKISRIILYLLLVAAAIITTIRILQIYSINDKSYYIGFSALSVMVTFFLIYVVSVRPRQRLSELCEGLNALGKGSFSVRVTVPKRGRHHYVNTIFNWTAGQLEKMRKNTKRELNKQESQFKKFVGEINTGYAVIRDGILLSCNEAMSRITGYSMKELSGMEFSRLAAPEFTSSLELVLDKVQSSAFDSEKRIEVKAIHRDGRSMTLEIFLNKRIHETRAAVIGLIRDISFLKHREKQLSIPADILENTREMAVAVDSEEYIIYTNRAFAVFMGYTEDEVTGKLLTDLVSPKDIEILTYALKKISEEGKVEVELTVKRKDDIEQLILISLFEFRDSFDGTSIFGGIARDITGVKLYEMEREEKIRMLKTEQSETDLALDSLGDAVIWCDSDLIIQNINHRFTTLLGWEPDEVKGKLYREIVDCRDDRGEVQNEKECRVLESLCKGIITHDCLFILDRTGRQQLLESVNAPIKNEMGKTIGVIRSMREYN